jgi:superoxide dismutase, Fe-Mn family
MDTIQAKTFPDSLFSLDGISKKTIEEHLKLYQGYVKKTNEILEKLRSVDITTANQVYSDVRELKVELSFALGGVKNHEIYFGHLGRGTKNEPTGTLRELIERDFGSYEKWVIDLKASAMAARGWVWLAYNWNLNTLFNFIGDSQNTYSVWDSSVILALDTYEHAYFIDYGTDRKSYIEAFLRNLNWDTVSSNAEDFLISHKSKIRL